MLELPRRIGHNQALGATTAILLELHHILSMLACNDGIASSTVRKSYLVIAAVRQTLDNLIRAREPETFCAVMMIIQGSGYLLSAIESFKSPYGNGAAALLMVRGFPGSSDPFEASMYYMPRFHVALQTLFDPSLTFTYDEWRKDALPKDCVVWPKEKLEEIYRLLSLRDRETIDPQCFPNWSSFHHKDGIRGARYCAMIPVALSAV